MAYCSKCGKKLQNDSKFCPKCGTQVSKKDYVEEISKNVKNVLDTEDTTQKFTKKDIEENKAMGILAYLGVLAFAPYFGAKHSKFAQYHAKQGMNLLLLEVIYTVLYSLLSLIKVTRYEIQFGIKFMAGKVTPWFITWPLGLIGLIIFTLVIIGIVNASNGKAKELPIIGGIKIFK